MAFWRAPREASCRVALMSRLPQQTDGPKNSTCFTIPQVIASTSHRYPPNNATMMSDYCTIFVFKNIHHKLRKLGATSTCLWFIRKVCEMICRSGLVCKTGWPCVDRKVWEFKNNRPETERLACDWSGGCHPAQPDKAPQPILNHGLGFSHDGFSPVGFSPVGFTPVILNPVGQVGGSITPSSARKLHWNSSILPY